MNRNSASYIASILAVDSMTVQSLIEKANLNEIEDDVLVRAVETKLLSIEADISNLRHIMEG